MTSRDLGQSRCSACGAPIQWCKTINGKSIPMDPDGDEHGNMTILDDGTAIHVKPEDGYGLYTSHFATCPNAEEFRRR